MAEPAPHPEEFWRRLRRAIEQVPVEARTPPEDARVGAVLALFEDTPDGPGLVLTRRRRDLRSHPGQLSFPGGRLDPGETVEEAALREAEEEIGLDPGTVELVGAGPTFFIPPSRFWVVPVVARWSEPHELAVNPWEVDEILRVPVATLLERDRWRHVPLSEAGSMWAWVLGEDLLWGATAMMVATILHVVLDDWTGGMEAHELGSELEVRPWEEFPFWEPRRRLEGLPEVDVGDVAVVSGDQARAVARLLADDARVELSQVLEQVGRAAAEAVRQLAGGDLGGASVTVLAGPGTNGAAGLATARLLDAAGAEPVVLLVGAPRFPGQVDGLRDVGVAVRPFDATAPASGVVVDAMLGVGGDPPVVGAVADAIAWLQRTDLAVVALDLPSGMHPDDGIRGACVTADVTIALGAPKPAHLMPLSRPYLGDLELADLGIPAELWRRAGVEPVAVFGRGPLVRLVGLDEI